MPITSTELLTKLSQEYQVVCFVDLAELTVHPSSAYHFFKKYFKESYSSNERLIIYTSCPIADELVKHLYQMTSLVDISNCFVLICSNNNIIISLNNLAKEYASDVTPFAFKQVNLLDTTRLADNFILPDSMCPLPWMHLEVDQKGDIHPCCVSPQIVGNVTKNSIVDVFYSDYMASIRESFLQGNKPSQCDQCWTKESTGLTSNRLFHIKFLKKLLLEKYLERPQLSRIDLKLGNVCNFKCRICNDTASSLHAQESAQVKKIPIVKTSNWASSDQFLNQIKMLTPNLNNIDMYGGEPFLIKQFSQILKYAKDNGYAQNIRLHYNTNGSIYPTELIEHWPHFQEVDIQFSIDAIGDRFDLERGSTWNNVESNILRLKSSNLNNVKISIMPSINAMNVYYIDEVINWAKFHGFTVNPNYVFHPAGLSLASLTKESKKMIINKHQQTGWEEICQILKTIQLLPDSDGIEFINITQYYDSIRKEDFRLTHPEIAKSQGYSV